MANEVRNLVVNGTTYPVGGLLVTLTTTTSGTTTTFTADKTAQEIYDAVVAGATPVIKHGNYYYPMTSACSNGTYLYLDYTNINSASISLYASSMSGYPSYSYSSGGGSND